MAYLAVIKVLDGRNRQEKGGGTTFRRLRGGTARRRGRRGCRERPPGRPKKPSGPYKSARNRSAAPPGAAQR